MHSCPLLRRTSQLILGNFTKRYFALCVFFLWLTLEVRVNEFFKISSVANSNYLKLKESVKNSPEGAILR